jgi:hypothetical protein
MAGSSRQTEPPSGGSTVFVELDDDAKLAEYAHPERLVTTDWLAKRLLP